MNDTDNAYDPYAAAFEFGGAADTGHRPDDFDSEDYGRNPFWCAACGEIAARKHESRHTAGVCKFCCPIHAHDRAAEVAADLEWERANGIA